MNQDETHLRDAAAAVGAPPPAVVEALVRRAGDEGLVDISYGEMDSPLGPLLVAVTARGLVQLSYRDHYADALRDLARRLSPRILRHPAKTDGVRRQLDEYFAGRRRDFDIPLDWSLIRGFGRRVLEATAAIPFGAHLTYSEVAGRAGNARASRAAGNALGANPIPIVIPCHRVLRTGGALGGYTSGLDKKRLLLRLEGVLAGQETDL
jgi:methylated-DNA-[protein]-cysteine S-methyltransferase